MTDNRCDKCKHWTQTQLDHSGKVCGIYYDGALSLHPEWASRGLCIHPSSKMHPEWEGAEAIATDCDFGCVQFKRKP